MNVLSRVGDEFRISFDYDPQILTAVKEIPGRRYDQATKSWTVPSSSVAVVAVFAKAWKLFITPEAIELGKNARHRIDDSRAQTAELTIPGLGGTLMPFQKAGVSYAVNAQRVIIGDEQGLGKTIEALATLEASNAFPALIICPASVKLNWEREAHIWLPKRTVEVVSGRSPVRTKAEIVVVNFNIVAHQAARLATRGFAAVVVDESQYVKNSKAARTKACQDLIRGKRSPGGEGHPRKGSLLPGQREIPTRLFLTGTMILNRPIELVSQLTMLDRMNDIGGYQQFLSRYCGGWNRETGGYDTRGASNMDELNRKLRSSCYVRRLKADVLDELPAKTRAIVPVEIDNVAEYRKAAADLAQWLRDVGKSRAEINAAMRAEQLTRISYLKRIVAKGKMATVKEWVSTFLDSGEKLVLFAHHRSVVRALAEQFDAPMITGSTSIKNRQKIIDRFQNDPDCKLVVLNMQAGGVGITLTAASNVAFVELGWTPAAHAQAEDRTHRIGQTGAVTAWYLLADRTIDATIYRLLSKKSIVVSGVTDGAADGNGSIFDELLEQLETSGEDRLSSIPEWHSASKASESVQREAEMAPRTERADPVAPVSSPSQAAYIHVPAYRTETSRQGGGGRKKSAKHNTFVLEDDRVAPALVYLFQRQTDDEQAHGTTEHDNGVGFNALDAGFGSSLARQVLAGRTLSPKQLDIARTMLRKYRRQLGMA